MHVPQCSCQSQRISYESWFSPYTTWVLGIKLTLTAGDFFYQAILSALSPNSYQKDQGPTQL